MRIVKDADGNFYALRDRFEEKDLAKAAGFRFSGKMKEWWTGDPRIAAKLVQYADPSIRPQLLALQTQEATDLEASRASDADIEIPAPAGLDYLAYQRAGIAYASERPSTIIADEMGLGKTIQAIGVVNLDPTIRRILVVCPASLRINWQRELEKWLVRRKTIGMAMGSNWPWPDPAITIINYEILQKHKDRLREKTWDLLIVDEAHYLKNDKAQRTHAVLGRKKGRKKDERTGKSVVVPPLSPIPARRRLFLTGTPIINRPRELHPILYSIDPVTWQDFFKFGLRYCGGHRTRWGWDFDGATNLGELQDRLRRTCMVRRLKADVLTELPAKRRQVIELPVEGAAAAVKAEQEAWRHHQALIASLKAAVELAKASDDPQDYQDAVMELRTGARASFTEISIVRRLTAIAKIPYVVEHAKAALDAGIDKLVIFAHHHEVIDGLLDAFGADAVKLDGRDGMHERDDAVNRFQNDPAIRYFIGGIRAAGVGLTLTASANVVFAELDWTPGNLSQAEDRCHRVGQTGKVLVQHLVLEGSIDAQMANTVIGKQEIIDQALNLKPPAEEVTTLTPEKEEAATKETTRQQLEKEASSMTLGEIERIHADLRYLASLCDQAQAKDHAGFNRYDVFIGHSLARCHHLTARQAALGKKLTRKYKKQLKNGPERQNAV